MLSISFAEPSSIQRGQIRKPVAVLRNKTVRDAVDTDERNAGAAVAA